MVATDQLGAEITAISKCARDCTDPEEGRSLIRYLSWLLDEYKRRMGVSFYVGAQA